jgi:outer membrane biosynthesis protein TonB
MESYSPTKHRHSFFIIIVSLLLHVLVLFLLFAYQQYQESRALSAIHPEEIAPAAAQVIYQNQPEPEPIQSPQAPVQPQPRSLESLSQPQQEEAPQEPIATAPEWTEPSADQPSPAADHEQAAQPAIPTPTTLSKTPTTLQQEDAVLASSIVQAAAPQSPKKQRSGKKRKVTAQAAAALGALAHGFAKNIEREGGAAPAASSPQASLDDMTRQRYIKKVYSLIYQSVNARQRMVHLGRNIMTDAVLVVSIDKKGVLRDVRLEHPYKDEDIRVIERELCDGARAAGLYPPVPASFNTEVYTLRFGINIRCHEGFRSYYLSNAN